MSIVKSFGAPHARHECGFAEAGGRFFLFGGRGLKVTDVFDPVTCHWSEAAAPPFEVHHFQPVTFENNLWLFGAMTGQWPAETPLETALIYAPQQDAWQLGPDIPANRQRGAVGCVFHDGWFYLAGGIVDGHRSGTKAWFDRYNPRTNTWELLPDAPHKRDHAQLVVVNDRLYFVGGRETGRHNAQDYDAVFSATIPEVDVFDLRTNRWSTLDAPLPCPSAAAGCIAKNHLIYYVGGEAEPQEAFKDLYVLDTTTQQWRKKGALEQGRHGTNAIFYDDALWIASGCGNKGGTPELDSIEKLAL